MSRHRYLVAYDIRDGNRLREVHDVVVGFGDRLQYSVYVCDLSPQERIQLMGELRRTMDLGVDSVVFVDLGDTNRTGMSAFEFMGSRWTPPPGGGPRIV
jgi:CRISPR-associated protein Cas2